jgi:hypothetical protein
METALCRSKPTPCFRATTSSIFWIPAQDNKDAHASNTISKGDFNTFPSKVALLRLFQIAQVIADRPALKNLSPLGKNKNHKAKYCQILFGQRSVPNTEPTVPQNTLAIGHSKNKCCADSVSE